MPMIDMPVTPVAGAEVVIERRVGEAGDRGLSPVVLGRIVGVCSLVEANQGKETKTGLSPVSNAEIYFWKFEPEKDMDFSGATVMLIQSPQHGRLVTPEVGSQEYAYLPDLDYQGQDFTIFQVQKDGFKVEIHYLIHVTVEANAWYLCDDPNGSQRNSLINWGQTPIDRNAGLTGDSFVGNRF